MKRDYVSPETKIISISCNNIIAASCNIPYTCNELCRHWHFCQDRGIGKACADKKY